MLLPSWKTLYLTNESSFIEGTKKDAKHNKTYFVKKIQSYFQKRVDCFQSFFQSYAIDKDGLNN